MARVSHFEFMYEDPAAAARFYEAAFGWQTQIWEGGSEPYWLVSTGTDSEPGINGGFMHTMDGAPNVINTISVESVDEAIGKVESAGGTVVVQKMAVPGIGYQAYCRDPGGVVFGIHESDESAT